MRTPKLLLIAFIGLGEILACGEDPAPRDPRPARPARVAEAPAVSAPEAPRLRPPRTPKEPTGYQSAYHHPASLLRPLDGFPLPSGTRLRDRDQDGAVYEVEAGLGTIEAFYQERGFRITRPGRLPGLIVTRPDVGTRLQVQPGKHRVTLLRFYR